MREEEGSLTAHVRRTRKISRGEFKEGREGEKRREKKKRRNGGGIGTTQPFVISRSDGHGIGGAYY
jgi:hypothetical protein